MCKGVNSELNNIWYAKLHDSSTVIKKLICVKTEICYLYSISEICNSIVLFSKGIVHEWLTHKWNTVGQGLMIQIRYKILSIIWVSYFKYIQSSVLGGAFF